MQHVWARLLLWRRFFNLLQFMRSGAILERRSECGVRYVQRRDLLERLGEHGVHRMWSRDVFFRQWKHRVHTVPAGILLTRRYKHIVHTVLGGAVVRVWCSVLFYTPFDSSQQCAPFRTLDISTIMVRLHIIREWRVAQPCRFKRIRGLYEHAVDRPGRRNIRNHCPALIPQGGYRCWYYLPRVVRKTIHCIFAVHGLEVHRRFERAHIPIDFWKSSS